MVSSEQHAPLKLPIHLVPWDEWLEYLTTPVKLYPLYGIFLSLNPTDNLSNLLSTTTFWTNLNQSEVPICLCPIFDKTLNGSLQFSTSDFSVALLREIGIPNDGSLPGLMLFEQPKTLDFSLISFLDMQSNDILDTLALLFSQIIEKTNYHGNATEQLQNLQPRINELVELLTKLPKSSGFLRPNAEKELSELQSKMNALQQRLAKPELSPLNGVKGIGRLLRARIYSSYMLKEYHINTLIEGISKVSSQSVNIGKA